MGEFTLIGVLFVYVFILEGIRRFVMWLDNRPKKVIHHRRHCGFFEMP